ncbi:MAG TPA: type I-U CRISPR-associated protein Csb2, partial [Polyangiaceae bacterium]|nr:type I-U CRISPR-associated protein Csb2 [Polyangiaceae bacterium]
MPTLLLRFPGRRYHATPWGHHVNEGLVEWPPSPWRVLRALISVGYTKLGWTEVPPEGRHLLLTLAERLPQYRVPPAAAAHSRHYMPVGKLRKDGVENTTLVFDTWAQIEGGALVVSWDVELSPAASACLAALVERLGYLGRSESAVDAELLAPGAPLPPGLDVLPCDGATRPGRGWVQVPLLAPERPAEYARWLLEHGAPMDGEPSAEADADAGPTRKAR